MKQFFFICAIGLTQLLTAQPTIYLSLELAELTPSEKVYDFVVADYNNIVGSQYTILFDGTKMSFKEIRNPLLQNLTSHSFNEPVSGELRHVWIDPDLSAGSYEKPTIIYQLVFDIIEGEGSNLCLTNLTDNYEFIFAEQPGHEQLSFIIINDDCNEGLVLNLNTTGTLESENSISKTIHSVSLTANGNLSFTNTQTQSLNLTLFDINGIQIAHYPHSLYSAGRNEIGFHSALLQQIYIVQFQNEDGLQMSYSVMSR